MRQVMLASVRLYARRYVATALAVLVGVAFVVTTNALTSAARNGMLADLTAQYAGADAVVHQLTSARQAQLSATAIDAHPGAAAAVNGTVHQPLSTRGRPLTEDARIGTVSTDRRVRWQTVVRGRAPTGPGEAVVDVHTAGVDRLHLGDPLTVGHGPHRRTVRVTGLVASSTGALAAPVYLTWPALRVLPQPQVDNVVVATTGRSGRAAAAAVRRMLPERVTALSDEGWSMQVEPTGTYLQRMQRDFNQGVDVVAVMLLVFAAVAFFVSALVIANTFSVLLAQRSRDFALLRCVGATRRQIRRSVRAEALVVGVAATAAGLLVGAGAGFGLTALVAQLFPTWPVGRPSLSPLWLAGAALLGVGVTFGACLLPARRATRVSPLAALRPDLTVDVASRAGRLRLAAAGLALTAGAGVLWLSVDRHTLALTVLGGAVSFLGVLLLGPVLVPACVRGLGPAVRRLGVPGSLAASNAVRNPRRTAATTASLLVGVTLVSGLVVGMATVRDTVGDEMVAQYPLDATLTAAQGPLPGDVLGSVRDLDGVASAVALPGRTARIGGAGLGLGRLPVLAVTPGRAARPVRGKPEFLRPEDGTLLLSWTTLAMHGIDPGTRVDVRAGGHTVRLRLRGADGFGDVAVASPAVLARLGGPARGARAVWARAVPDVDAGDLQGSLQALADHSGARLAGSLGERASMQLQLDVMTGAALALLAVGVLIALVGIGNTLGLSVLERTREHALLRAMGLTRRQLRATLAVEALLMATVAGVLGTGLGSVYAWLAVHAVLGQVVDAVSVTFPVTRLLGVLGAAAVAGLLACVLPARRAARVTPAAGLSAD